MMIIKSKLGFVASLAVFSAIIVFSYNSRIKASPKSLRTANFDGPLALGFYDGARRLESVDDMDKETKDYMKKRILEVFKQTWPECVKRYSWGRMNAIQCKEFIDRVSWLRYFLRHFVCTFIVLWHALFGYVHCLDHVI